MAVNLSEEVLVCKILTIIRKFGSLRILDHDNSVKALVVVDEFPIVQGPLFVIGHQNAWLGKLISLDEIVALVN